MTMSTEEIVVANKKWQVTFSVIQRGHVDIEVFADTREEAERIAESEDLDDYEISWWDHECVVNEIRESTTEPQKYQDMYPQGN